MASQCMASLWDATITANKIAKINTTGSGAVTIGTIALTIGAIAVSPIGTTIIGTATLVSAAAVTPDRARKGLGVEA